MHITCAVITHGKPTEKQIDEILTPYFQYPAEFSDVELTGDDVCRFEEQFFAEHDSFPLWDWYSIGGRSAGIVVTPLDTPVDTLTYTGSHPLNPDACDDQVWGHQSNGAYIKDISRQHPLTGEPFSIHIYSVLTSNTYYDYISDESADKIIFDIFGKSDKDYYLTVVDLHI